jgi:hypothetical protein
VEADAGHSGSAGCSALVRAGLSAGETLFIGFSSVARNSAFATDSGAVTLLAIPMTSPILRILGAVAGLGSAILCWFLGTRVAMPLRHGPEPIQSGPQYALLAFLFIPALILAVVALFWVPPRVSGEGPLPEGRIWRLALVLLFGAAFISGLLR